jgi:hypothetical protein
MADPILPLKLLDRLPGFVGLDILDVFFEWDHVLYLKFEI